MFCTGATTRSICRRCGRSSREGNATPSAVRAVALYLRYVHAISYQRLTRLFRDLFTVVVSEGALDSMFRRAKRHVIGEVAAILVRLRRSRVICCDETTVRINGRTCWNWVFQNAAVVLHVVRPTRAAAVVDEVLDGHRPAFWVSDLYGGQQGHADLFAGIKSVLGTAARHGLNAYQAICQALCGRSILDPG
jgi:hypothetical protein